MGVLPSSTRRARKMSTACPGVAGRDTRSGSKQEIRRLLPYPIKFDVDDSLSHIMIRDNHFTKKAIKRRNKNSAEEERPTEQTVDANDGSQMQHTQQRYDFPSKRQKRTCSVSKSKIIKGDVRVSSTRKRMGNCLGKARSHTYKRTSMAAVTPSPALTRSKLRKLKLSFSSNRKKRHVTDGSYVLDLNCSQQYSIMKSSPSTSSTSSNQGSNNPYGTSSSGQKNLSTLKQDEIHIEPMSTCWYASSKYSSSLSHSHQVRCICVHDHDHNHPESLSDSYLSSYGQDYFRSLQIDENDQFGPYNESNLSPCFSASSFMSFSYAHGVGSCSFNSHSCSHLENSSLNSPSNSTSLSSSFMMSAMMHNVKDEVYQRQLFKKKFFDSTIDNDDVKNKRVCSSYFPDDGERNHQHQDEEKSYEKINAYMNYLPRKTFLSSDMRSVLMDWLIELAEEYNLQQMTLHLAVVLVDRCLARCTFVADEYENKSTENSDVEESSIGRYNSCSSQFGSKRGDENCISGYTNLFTKILLYVDRSTLQCLGCACMMIACKIHERKPPTADDFSYISANSYSRQEITRMELKVCTCLGFHLQYTTPHHFLHHFLRASAASISPPRIFVAQTTLLFMVQYLLELSFLVFDFVPRKASMTAAAALYLARATLRIRDETSSPLTQEERQKSFTGGFWSRALRCHTGYDMFDLETAVIELHKAHFDAEGHKLRSVFEKYGKEKYNFVALQTVAPKEILGFF